ncbi:hypothetical protein ElyMa_006890700 [Elysia marginata]|uniref:Reelin domain-containing protein n=1 Tax=Elysia marginata TaxID=1093978 RepID=A0AAV4JE99_9GAST|nr:hypothetical protein ElyMa_006890700 [Elysia marginata]
MKKMFFSGLQDFAFMAVIYALVFVEGVSAFGRGAPGSTCFTRYPKHHGIGTQTDNSPYTITVKPLEYRKNDVIEGM